MIATQNVINRLFNSSHLNKSEKEKKLIDSLNKQSKKIIKKGVSKSKDDGFSSMESDTNA